MNGVSDGTPVPIDQTLNVVFKRARWPYVLSLVPHLIHRVVRPYSAVDKTFFKITDCNGIKEGRGCRRRSTGFPYLGCAKQSFAAAWRAVASEPHRIARLAACCTRIYILLVNVTTTLYIGKVLPTLCTLHPERPLTARPLLNLVSQ